MTGLIVLLSNGLSFTWGRYSRHLERKVRQREAAFQALIQAMAGAIADHKTQAASEWCLVFSIRRVTQSVRIAAEKLYPFLREIDRNALEACIEAYLAEDRYRNCQPEQAAEAGQELLRFVHSLTD